MEIWREKQGYLEIWRTGIFKEIKGEQGDKYTKGVFVHYKMM